MTALLSVKNNYYVRRLAPFLLVYLAYELIEVAILAFMQGVETDWSTPAILQLLGNLLLLPLSHSPLPALSGSAPQVIPRQQGGPSSHHGLLCALLPPELL